MAVIKMTDCCGGSFKKKKIRDAIICKRYFPEGRRRRAPGVCFFSYFFFFGWVLLLFLEETVPGPHAPRVQRMNSAADVEMIAHKANEIPAKAGRTISGISGPVAIEQHCN